uniref:Uncharacterized protein n=1 Tax=Siphoviridae sp. ct89S11 TaxID=2825357 RepID=A0A8S5URC6_9CAUD|nr:MAG TPA: hypothetical protein [Siphoviridae sp. ct89S11]
MSAWKTTRQSQSIFDSRKLVGSSESLLRNPYHRSDLAGDQQARSDYPDCRWHCRLHRNHCSRVQGYPQA